MWAAFSHVGVVHEKPHWYYKILGNEEFINLIDKQDRFVLLKGVGYYRMRKFYGPIITFAKKNINGFEKYMPGRSNGIPELQSKMLKVKDSNLAYYVNNKRFYKRLGEKYLPDIFYDKRDDIIKIDNVIYTDWDKILIMSNAFINFIDKSYFIKFFIEWGEKELEIRLSYIINYILGNKSGVHSFEAAEFLSFLENEYQLSESFSIDKEFKNDLYPLSKIELHGNKYAGLTTYTGGVNTQKWSIEYMEIPICLFDYVKFEFKSYAVKQAVWYDDWLHDQRHDADNGGYDYREIIQDGLDDMRQSDANWHWNID